MRLATDSMKMAAAKNSNVPKIRKNIDADRLARRIAQLSVVAMQQQVGAEASLDGRAQRRARAAALRERMMRYSRIYNAAYMVRYSQHGAPARRQEFVMQFVAALVAELRQCSDFEALIFAIADSLTSDPHGVPWEG